MLGCITRASSAGLPAAAAVGPLRRRHVTARGGAFTVGAVRGALGRRPPARVSRAVSTGPPRGAPLRVEANNNREPSAREVAIAKNRAAREEARMLEETKDLLTGESYTREVLMNYENQNSLFFFRTFALGSTFLLLSAALVQSVGGVVNQTTEDAASVLGGNVAVLLLLFAILRADLKGRRVKLDKMKAENALGNMQVVGTNRMGNEVLTLLRELRGVRRLCILYGGGDKIAADVANAAIYAQQLESSSILVVPVLAKGEAAPAAREQRHTWLAWPSQNDKWAEYFEDLTGSKAGSGAARFGAYVTVGTTGAVRGSGVGSPVFDVLLSSFPRNKPGTEAPAEPLSALSRSDSEAAQRVLQLHREFYTALDAGDEAAMSALWENGEDTARISRFAAKGARLDGWATVLKPDRRPVGMVVGAATARVEGDTAWVTCEETVANGSTLLATQQFKRSAATGDWQLVAHQTVPYGKDIVAKVVLTCDTRGCMALPSKALASYRAGEDDADAP